MQPFNILLAGNAELAGAAKLKDNKSQTHGQAEVKGRPRRESRSVERAPSAARRNTGLRGATR